MANIRKTFNFRNGVQVDEKNLIVNPLGLVGIGTTVPTETLDVRGTVKVVGVITAQASYSQNIVNTGIATINSARIGILSVTSSGIVTATSLSGIITYYGDGGRLLNLPTSQWLDIDIGLGFTSIYAQGFVGVATNSPREVFQIGGSQIFGQPGVGINSRGGIVASGIVTANSFSGSGANITLIAGENIATGTISSDRLPIIPPAKIPDSFEVVGIITALSGLVGNLKGNVTGNLVGIASTALSLPATTNLGINSFTAGVINAGIVTISTRANITGSVGFNTLTPQSDIHITKTGISSIQLTGTTESYFTLGRTVNQISNNAGLKFGNTSGIYPLSNTNSFDIINYDRGNFNSYLHFGSTTGLAGTGGFNWIYGKDPLTALMTLSYTGNLGLGVTNPTEKLKIVGVTSITGNAFVDQNLFVKQNLNVTGNLNLSGSNNLSIDGKNVNATTGISTVNNLKVLGFQTIVDKLGIRNDSPVYPVHVGTYDGVINSVFLSENGIGIGTTALTYGSGFDALKVFCLFGGVGVGSTVPKSYADFSFAGRGIDDTGRYFIPPTVTATQRNNLSNNAGGLIFNSTTSTHQGFNGSWYDITNPGYALTAGISTNINISATTSTDTTTYPTLVANNATGAQQPFIDNANLSYNASTNVLISSGGFSSGTGGGVQISVVGNTLTFTVAGTGSATLTLV
jgi:hypothetical protein